MCRTNERTLPTVDHSARGSMKDAARRESWCELQNTQIIDVPNVHDGRKSNGQVRFSVKTKLLSSPEDVRGSAPKNLFELVAGVRRCSIASAECPDHSALGHERWTSVESRAENGAGYRL